MTIKASDRCDILCLFYNPIITNLTVATELQLDIPVLINFSNCNIILHDVLLVSVLPMFGEFF